MKFICFEYKVLFYDNSIRARIRKEQELHVYIVQDVKYLKGLAPINPHKLVVGTIPFVIEYFHLTPKYIR